MIRDSCTVRCWSAGSWLNSGVTAAHDNGRREHEDHGQRRRAADEDQREAGSRRRGTPLAGGRSRAARVKTGTNAPCSAASANSAAHQVRELEGDRERGHRRRDAEHARGDDLAYEARDARDAGRRGEEKRAASRSAGARSASPPGSPGPCRGRDIGSGRPPPRRYSTRPPRRLPRVAGARASMANIASQEKRILRAERERRGEPSLHLDDQDLLPPPRGGSRRQATPSVPPTSTASWSRWSIAPSSAARCIAMPARARSRARRVCCAPSRGRSSRCALAPSRRVARPF